MEDVTDKSNIVKEADLSGHLDNKTDQDDGADAGGDTSAKAKKRSSLPANDYELYEALNVLKGLSILKKAG